MAADNFIDVPFSLTNLDRYIARTAIFNALRNSLYQLDGELLDIGCGKMPYKGYILNNSSVTTYTGLDIEDALTYDSAVKPDFFWEGTKMPFQDLSFTTALATEVLEHCPDPSVVIAETYRVLKKEGVLFFTVPFLWPLHEVPHDEFRYTPFSLERLLKNAGFQHVELHATGGWHASMAQMLGLWVRRSPLSSRKRAVLSRLLRPAIGYLVSKDQENISFTEGQMITGLYGIARK
ncbi:MAG TPA: class I SAM-dependent methyltransferase [Flavipsychrobacter sp.]|nr:class I SAM-dependent methyltransferase [Flavipsychrobacter sp.]